MPTDTVWGDSRVIHHREKVDYALLDAGMVNFLHKKPIYNMHNHMCTNIRTCNIVYSCYELRVQ